MTLKDFESQYNFHDSFIKSMSYDESKRSLTLVFNFAFWMQKDFVEGEEENGLLEATFHNVTSYEREGGNPVGDFVGVLNTAVEDGCISFNLLDDKNAVFMKLKIVSSSVEVKKPY